jgi:ribosomal protein S8
MLQQLQETIDRAVKEVWVSNIQQDYLAFHLLKEDTLKNAIYYHLHTKLNNFLTKNNLRIFTEYHHKGFIADLAIVKLTVDPGRNLHLKDDVESVLAVIEVKYKADGNEKPFVDDVRKIKSYIDTSLKIKHNTIWLLSMR